MDSKFIQIATSRSSEELNDDLYALDDQGQVWFYRHNIPEDKAKPNGWVKMNPTRHKASWEK